MELDKRMLEPLVLGGGLLGAGGGGTWTEGLDLLRDAIRIGRPKLVPIDDLEPSGIIVTVSGVGAPAATEDDVRISDHLRSLELFLEHAKEEVAGIVTSENGGFSTANGFVQSALLGIPVVDAPGNGRAHPTGVMGSMGLHRKSGYISKQASVGGTPGLRRVEQYIQGDLASVDHVVRQAAVAAGGLIAVTRNPVPASYVREHGAPGALALALEIGDIICSRRDQGGRAVAEGVLDALGEGEILEVGAVSGFYLKTEGGYDVGRLRVGQVQTTFWNEFMTAERSEKRLATFPDLIFALDAKSGLPVTTASLEDGLELVLASVPRSRLPLGAGVKDPNILKGIEDVLHVPILEP